MELVKNLHIKPSKEVIEGCLLLSNRITFDMMSDSSFSREKADKGLYFVLNNINDIIQFQIEMNNDFYTWLDKKISLTTIKIEIRDRKNYITYLLSMEIPIINIDELYLTIQNSII